MRFPRKRRAGLLLAALAFAAGCGSDPAPEPSTGAPDTAADEVVNTLSWTAATEQGVFGYLVYRSDQRDGPFRRLNERIVRVPDDDLEQHSYTYEDRAVEPGRTYYYYLDVVSRAGAKQRFSGVISKTTPG